MPYGQPRTAIGRRRERAIVYRAPTSDDGMGGQAPNVPAASKIAEIWVRPVPLDKHWYEAIAAGQLSAQVTYHFDTRYRTDIKPTMYLAWRGRRLEIHTIADDEALARRMILLCSEVANSGA